MVHLIKDIPNLQIVEVTVDGLLDLDTQQQVLSKALLQLMRTHYQRLMIDIIDTFSPLNQTMTDALYLISFMRTIGFHESMRLAFIFQNEEDLRWYLESAALAQGFHLKYFRKRERAIAWLCTQSL